MNILIVGTPMGPIKEVLRERFFPALFFEGGGGVIMTSGES